MDKYCELLELHKVLKLLENQCSNEKTKKLALELEPMNDLFMVQREVDKTSCALELSIKFRTPAFSNFKDVSDSVKRAESGAVLSLKELIEIINSIFSKKVLIIWLMHY